MRPSATATSMPQPFEHRTHADCTHRTALASTPGSMYSSTRAGHGSPAACGVLAPQMSLMRSVVGLRCVGLSELAAHARFVSDALNLFEQASVDGGFPAAAPAERQHRFAGC